MLRIDETTGTLVAPGDAFGDEPALPREELAALLRAGWAAFAAEIGRPGLHPVPATLPAGIDLLTVDEAGGRLTVVVAGGGLEAALRAAATVAGWEADHLAAVHPMLSAAVPGASPRVLLVDGAFDDATLGTLDWLVRNHGLEAAAHRVRVMRLGAERLVQIETAYPAGAPAEDAAGFVAALAGSGAADHEPPPPLHSAPPPGVVA